MLIFLIPIVSCILLWFGFSGLNNNRVYVKGGRYTAPAEIVLSGYYFGTKKGKVYLEDSAGKKKTCKVTEWSMYDKVYGDSSIRFIVPKVSKSLPAGSYVLKVENKVGAVIASTNFTLQ